jgi:hypothetical protein
MDKPMAADHKQRIADLERELKFRGGRINELKDELDEQRDLVRRMEEHIKECDEEYESFILAFGLVLDDNGKYSNGEFIAEYNALVEKHNGLIDRHNKLVGRFNRNIASVNPVGRPMATSEAQQAEILKHHKAGRSSRWIADEMTLSRQSVMTVIGKHDGTDRVTQQRRLKLWLEPKIKDWRIVSRQRLPRAATAHIEKCRKLLKEAKRLG